MKKKNKEIFVFTIILLFGFVILPFLLVISIGNWVWLVWGILVFLIFMPSLIPILYFSWIEHRNDKKIQSTQLGAGSFNDDPIDLGQAREEYKRNNKKKNRIKLIIKLFNPYNKIEKELLKTYSDLFCKENTFNAKKRAKKTAKKMLDNVIRESKIVGSYILSPDWGDRLIASAKIGGCAHEYIKILHKEGVRDDDIRQWWGLNDIERGMIMEYFRIDHGATIIVFTKVGKTREEAKAFIKENYPIYGYPEDTEDGWGEDRPLPFELEDRITTYFARDRVNAYGKKLIDGYPEEVESKVEFSSMNAFVRNKMRKGEI